MGQKQWLCNDRLRGQQAQHFSPFCLRKLLMDFCTLLLLLAWWLPGQSCIPQGVVLGSDIEGSNRMEIRLVEGHHLCSGRVEVLLYGQWQTVCDDGWGIEEAMVVCKELGCGAAVSVTTEAQFGNGGLPIALSDIRCRGTESAISQCATRPRGGQGCSHEEAAGVLCFGETWGTDPVLFDQMKIRLLGGPNNCSGRVELLHNGVWGTICGDRWGIKEAGVVCQQTDCGTASLDQNGAQFGNGTGPIWLDDIHCRGTESSLYQCPASPWGMHDCDHTQAAGVVCSGVRLVGGPTPCSGRVEVFHNKKWGTVCDNGWDMEDAHVVCREVGCGGEPLTAATGVMFGEGSGPIWKDQVNCTGREIHLKECPQQNIIAPTCDHSKDVGVECAEIKLAGGCDRCVGRVEIFREGQWKVVHGYDWNLEGAKVVCRYLDCGTALAAPRESLFRVKLAPVWMARVNCTGSETSLSECKVKPWDYYVHHMPDPYEVANVICTELRLVNGSNPCSGRVEVFHKEKWGTVCDAGWDLQDAQVVCRELNCGYALKAFGGARFGKGAGPIWLERMNCTGREESLRQCPKGLWGEHSCDHSHDASVECADPTKIRLADGPHSCSGRIEILRNQQWGTVCHYDWDMMDARVVCKELGCGDALLAPGKARFGKGNGPIWLSRFSCKGTEDALNDCPQLERRRTQTCSHEDDAGVVCSEFRLVNGSNSCSGRVEVLRNQQWGTVCDAGWDSTDAQVVCREQSCGNVIKVFGGAHYGQGSGPIWLKGINCTGEEASLSECAQSTGENHNCDHTQDASVECSSKVRLVNGSSLCSGKVEVLHNQKWKVLCGDFWNSNDAQVVCRELGCGEPIWTPSSSYFEIEPDDIELYVDYCSGTETSLADCALTAFEGKGCFDNIAATVKCSELHLVNGTNRCSGRIEVLHNLQWGTVCNAGWDSLDTQVVCRELNCGDASKTFLGGHYGQGSGPIWLQQVNCTGEETSLTLCPKDPFGKHSCHHSQDVSVECTGRVRLVNGSSRCSGRVEVFYEQQWKALCDDDWDEYTADAVCEIVGCGKAISVLSGSHFGINQNPIHLGLRSCVWTGTSLYECDLSHSGTCHSGSATGIICSGVRLVPGPNRCSGRVEVFRNQQWENVCDSGWDSHDAQVVCRELNCGNVAKAFGRARYGKGYGPIWQEGVNCTGEEASLRECPPNLWGEYNCNHDQDASVECSWRIRLVNGSSRCSGRVEVFYNKQWEAICGEDWNLDKAHLVCRELDCGEALSATEGSPFGSGLGHIRLHLLDCQGHESAFADCVVRESGEESCASKAAAGVICSEVRLVNGPHRCSGRIEVLHNQLWGTVCDAGWDAHDAQVVCRQLGCGNVLKVFRGAHYGHGYGPVWLERVNCSGEEASLSECPQSPWGEHNCNHSQDASVECSGQVRLVNGSSRCSGRVEVLYKQHWEAVCNKHWNLNVVAVVCRELTCGIPLKFPRESHFERQHDPIKLSVDCSDWTKHSLAQCELRDVGEQKCSREVAVDVLCSEVRLMDGRDDCSGRVEVFYNHTWGTVCDWDLNSAQVVCKEHDCGDALAVSGGASFGEGTGPIWKFNTGCQGNEKSFSLCHLRSQEKHSCTHEDDVGVVCTKTRLVNGPNRCSGRVEVFLHQQWGTVCDDGWDLSNAQVVCRELGCGRALSAPEGAHFGQGKGPIQLDDIKCLGTEVALQDCIHKTTHDCRHEEDASVVCSDIRVVNGTGSCSGRVEVFHNDNWGTICDAGWDLQDAQVVCRQLGCGKASKALGGAHYGQGSGPIWMETLNCTGEEAYLRDCQKTARGEHSCSHNQDASVECSGVESVSTTETSIHLGVAGLVLIVLVAIVAEAGCSRRRRKRKRQS